MNIRTIPILEPTGPAPRLSRRRPKRHPGSAATGFRYKRTETTGSLRQGRHNRIAAIGKKRGKPPRMPRKSSTANRTVETVPKSHLSYGDPHMRTARGYLAKRVRARNDIRICHGGNHSEDRRCAALGIGDVETRRTVSNGFSVPFAVSHGARSARPVSRSWTGGMILRCHPGRGESRFQPWWQTRR